MGITHRLDPKSLSDLSRLVKITSVDGDAVFVQSRRIAWHDYPATGKIYGVVPNVVTDTGEVSWLVFEYTGADADEIRETLNAGIVGELTDASFRFVYDSSAAGPVVSDQLPESAEGAAEPEPKPEPEPDPDDDDDDDDKDDDDDD